jgi:hypothetical protein
VAAAGGAAGGGRRRREGGAAAAGALARAAMGLRPAWVAAAAPPRSCPLARRRPAAARRAAAAAGARAAARGAGVRPAGDAWTPPLPPFQPRAAARPTTPPLCPTSTLPRSRKRTCARPPQVAAAHARHVRDMALLSMEVDRAKAAGELERARAALAELRAAGGGGGGGGPAAGAAAEQEAGDASPRRRRSTGLQAAEEPSLAAADGQDAPQPTAAEAAASGRGDGVREGGSRAAEDEEPGPGPALESEALCLGAPPDAALEAARGSDAACDALRVRPGLRRHWPALCCWKLAAFRQPTTRNQPVRDDMQPFHPLCPR